MASNIIKYKFNEHMSSILDKKDISEFLESASLKNSPWYTGLPQYASSPAKNYLSHWKLWWNATKNGDVTPDQVDQEFTHANNKVNSLTGKKCPGIIGVLNKSWIVKSPVEAIIHVENGDIRSTHCSDPRYLEIDSHQVFQYRGKGNTLFHTKKSLKLTLPVQLSTKLPYLFLNPIFHKENDFYPVPGVIEDKWMESTTLVVHCMVDISTDRYITIKPGDPIAYMWFPEKTKLAFDNNIKDKRFQKFLNQPLDIFGYKK